MVEKEKNKKKGVCFFCCAMLFSFRRDLFHFLKEKQSSFKNKKGEGGIGL